MRTVCRAAPGHGRIRQTAPNRLSGAVLMVLAGRCRGLVPQGLSGHLLQPGYPVIHRRVGGKELFCSTGERVGDHQV